jgi:Protein of unknown function (DUF1579)
MNVRSALTSLCMTLLIFGTSVIAQEPTKAGAEHKILAADEGTWDATVKSFAPGVAEPVVSKGTEVNEMTPGGIWLLRKFDGVAAGTKFQGRGQFSYNPAKKKYVGTWIDSLGPDIGMLEGAYDAKTKTLTFVGDGVASAANAKYSQKMVTTTKDDGSRVFMLTMKFEGAPDEMKLLEITYTKRKK